MDDFVVKKLVDGRWEETYMKHLNTGDTFIICRYLNHLNEYISCLDEDGCAVWKVSGKPYVHPIYGLWVTPVEPTLSRNNPIKFLGGGHMVLTTEEGIKWQQNTQ